MCFSPEASFVASALLTVITVVSYYKISCQKEYGFQKKLLTLVPLGFAIQQFSEGFVWLSLLHNYSALVRTVSTYLFMFFAFIFWPAYIPFCAYRLEQNEIRKDVLRVFSMIGLFTAGVLLIRMLYFGVHAQLASCHIMYTSNLSEFSSLAAWILMIAYLIATVGSLLVSSFPGIRFMGILIGFAYLITYLFYINFLISVWCFLAAAISLLVYNVVIKK